MGATAAIAGLGITEMGKVYGRTPSDFAGEAIALALEDAGLEARDVDGLLVNANHSDEMAPTLQFSLGFVDLTLLSAMSAFGSTAGSMLQYAAHAIESGQANVVVCVYADAPLTNGASISESAYGGRGFSAPGFAGLRFAYGDYGPANSMYALALRRHMHLFGTNHDQLGTIAVGQREWALMNPRAQMHKPMTIDDYHASRWVVEPLHLFDCCLVSNGAVAVVVTSARAGAGPAPAAGVPARLRAVRAGRHRAGRARAGGPHRRRHVREAGAAPGGDRALGRRRPRALRLLHLHGPRHPRGLRVLREGRGRRLRRRRQARPRRLAAVQHGRRPALLVLHVGLHAAGGGRHPGARPGRRAPGPPSTTTCSSPATAAP